MKKIILIAALATLTLATPSFSMLVTQGHACTSILSEDGTWGEKELRPYILATGTKEYYFKDGKGLVIIQSNNYPNEPDLSAGLVPLPFTPWGSERIIGRDGGDHIFSVSGVENCEK